MLLHRIEVGLRDELPDPAAAGLIQEIKTLGLRPPSKVRTARLFWIEADFGIDAARKLARPVKWRADRSEDFLAAHMGRDQHFKAKLALDAEGRILALKMEMLGNFGSVPVGSTAMVPLMVGPKVVTSVYRVPVVDYWIRGVLTNTMATAGDDFEKGEAFGATDALAVIGAIAAAIAA